MCSEVVMHVAKQISIEFSVSVVKCCVYATVWSESQFKWLRIQSPFLFPMSVQASTLCVCACVYFHSIESNTFCACMSVEFMHVYACYLVWLPSIRLDSLLRTETTLFSCLTRAKKRRHFDVPNRCFWRYNTVCDCKVVFWCVANRTTHTLN